ncbi:MAG TPA: SDR family NAD(P)-dependent oxidoreductase [Actinocrinis sp.]|uniref:SDR family NAD(P)-dependent oxidoreductase n=1 Tax=Actinocrinis sp. TaxID=1920516 RepID=UPI002D64BB36|nr:SDR family NAD(P)-dependent oxidoreductase [Actinocrinis sp.]HZU55353.1 SDR family NAD(P)-dependent oxidoreductase [Actinocrinis sp.]
MEPSSSTENGSASAVTPLSRALDTIKRLRAQLDAGQGGKPPIAIVGAGLRLPGGVHDLDGYWEALESGRDLIRQRPQQRLAPFAQQWAKLPNLGSFLDEVLGFDADFFGISPREARAVDPQHRLMLEVAWEALEDAALPPDNLRDARVGVYVGITGRQDYQDWKSSGPDAYWATGNGHSFAAGRIAYVLGFTGPAVAIDTACSSSLTAIHQAVRALRHGEIDVALAGGVNLVLSPGSTELIAQTRSLAPDGRCKTFDARANGYVRGEGAGVIALKRLDQAIRDGDRIHAVIKGSATNQDGRSSGFTAPNVLAQIAVLEAALADAELTPADIGLIEAHGTGTALGDPIEMDAIVAALGRKNGGAPLHVGSVKANIGHLEAASGIAGVLKSILVLRKGIIPPLVHFRTLNPRIDLDGTGVTVSGSAQPWDRSAAGSHVGVSSFGIVGTNAHVILGPADAVATDATGARPDTGAATGDVAGFELSAKSEGALRELAGRLAECLTDLPSEQYSAFAYTTTHGRTRHPVVARIAAPTPAKALNALRALAAGKSSKAVTVREGATVSQLPELPGLSQLPRQVITLPNYPWERDILGPEGVPLLISGGAQGPATEDSAAADVEVEAPGEDAPFAEQSAVPMYELEWQELSGSAGRTQGADREVVLAGDDAELIELLAASAEANGLTHAIIGPAVPDWSAIWEVRGAQLDAGAGAGAGQSRPISLILAQKATPLPETSDAVDVSDPTAAGAELCAAITHAVRAFADSGLPGQVYALTRATRQVTGQDPIIAGNHGLLHGLLPVLGLEYSSVWGGVIDLPAEPNAADAAIALSLTGSGTAPDAAADDLLAVREGRAYGARIRPVAADWRPELPVHPDATYLLTGGLGGIGREMALDLIRRGARHLLLVGRTPEADLHAAAAAALGNMRALGARVVYRSADVESHASLAAAIAAACDGDGGLPPVRGIIHTAGALPHKPLAEATAADFAEGLRGKFAGAWWLHLLSRDRAWDLDFFVQTSSASALWGHEGRGAYTAANGGLDAIAAYRVSAGLPATAIAYGAWALDGMADEAGRQNLGRVGIIEMDPATGCSTLAAHSASPGGFLIACPVDWSRFTTVMGTLRRRALFDEVKGAGGELEAVAAVGTTGAAAGANGSTGAAGAGASTPLRDELLALPENARGEAAAVHIGRMLAKTLGYPEGRAVPPDTGFFDLGLDSIMAVDLARDLSVAFAVKLRVAEVFNNPRLTALSEHVARKVAAGPANVTAKPVPSAAGASGATRSATQPTAAVTQTLSATAGQRAASQSSSGAVASPAEPIAIVGMAGRFPGADSVDELWDLLREGRDAVGPVPANRWDGAALHDNDPLRVGTISTDQGGFLRDIDRFDASFFGIPAREAESLDPQQRLLLESAWHALEDAAIDPKSLKGSKTGVYVGVTNSDYSRLLERGGLNQLDAYFGSGTSLNVAAGRISYLLGLSGPAMAVDTACSSSLVALHLAIRSLRSGEIDRALAGGVNVIVSPECSVAISRAHMLSPDGRCKTFSADANGFVRAEGCGVLVLKRLSDAQRDGDRVLAVLHGSAVNQDGASSGLTVPNGAAQEQVIAAALADARIDAAAVSYLEAHGTGTSLGDPIELNAAWAVFGKDRKPGEPLHVGSIKSNIGHCESASGMAGVFKTVLALRHRQLPASLHAETLNPFFPWDEVNIRVVDSLTSWRTGDRPRYAAVSSFGFSGTNAQVILGEAAEAAPVVAAAAAEPKPVAEGEQTVPYLVPISAPDPAGLRRLTELWQARLASVPEDELGRLATAAASGRAHFPLRRLLLGADRAELLAGLREHTLDSDSGSAAGSASEPARTKPPKVAFLFSGAGSQYFGMGRELYETEPVFRQTIDACDVIAAPQLGISLLDLMFYGADEELIDQIRFTQPTTVALELALAALWKSWGVTGSVVTGHSVGEIAAAIYAGVMDLETGLTLVVNRARLMQGTGSGAMLSLAAPLERVEGWLRGTDCDVAAINGPQSIVVAGLPGQIETVAERARAEEVKARVLTISAAAHSRLIDAMLPELRSITAPMSFSRPHTPVISNLTGTVGGPSDFDAEYWLRHVRQPVRFHEGAQQLAGLGVDAVLELGPDQTLINMITAAELVPHGGAVPSLNRGAPDRAIMLTAAGMLYRQGQDLDWSAVHAATGNRRTDAPLYPFADTRYWTRVKPVQAAAVEPIAPAKDQRKHWGAQLRSPAIKGRAFAFERTAAFPKHLGDHRIEETVLVPASSHLATILSAVGGNGKPVAISDLVCRLPLVIKDGEQYDVQLLLNEGQGAGTALGIHSLVDPDRGTWETHLNAKLLGAASATARQAPDREAFIASAERHISGETFYGFFRELGYTLGPSFRWIAEIWLRGDEALLRYEQPPVPEPLENYEIYPGLIDSYFQSIAGFMVDDQVTKAASLAIPFAIDKIAFPGRPAPGGELWSHVRIVQSKPLPNGRKNVETADLHLFNAAGESLIVADGFRVRPVGRTVLRQSLRKGTPNAYELAWVACPEQSAPTNASRRIAVLGDGYEPGKALAARLRADGHTLVGDLAASNGSAAELILDARFADLDGALDAIAAQEAALDLWAALKDAPQDVPYVVLGDGRTRAAAVREALWGMLAALEAEQPRRRVVRVELGENWSTDELTAILARTADGTITETRLRLDAEGLRIPRLIPAPAAAEPPAWNGSILITGGLGALGLSVARTVVEQGARQLTLLGRSAPDETARGVIAELEGAGATVRTVSGDVTDAAAVARAVATATENAPLSGVFHLAGVTADHAFDQLTAKDFAAVFAAKARGAEVLAAAVDGIELTAFVLFSSAAGLLGSAGQANYGAANGFLDGLAHTLREAGVPATSVDWGPWIATAKGGMAANAATGRAAEKLGIKVLTDSAAAPVLALAATTSAARLLAIDADFKQYAEQIGDHPRAALLAHLTKDRSRPETATEPAQAAGNAADGNAADGNTADSVAVETDASGKARGWLRDRLRTLDADERYDLARDTIRGFAGDLLGDPAKVDDDCGFEEMDMDSIMMIDLGDLLSHAMDDDLSAVVAINYPTIQELARHLTTLVRDEAGATQGQEWVRGQEQVQPTRSAPATGPDPAPAATPSTEPAPTTERPAGDPPAQRELTEEELLDAIRRDLAMEL